MEFSTGESQLFPLEKGNEWWIADFSDLFCSYLIFPPWKLLFDIFLNGF